VISFDSIPAIYLAQGVTDLRKGIDQLSAAVQNTLDISPFEDALFIFCNKSRDKIKILYWDKTGFWLLNKRLEEGKFQWDRKASGALSITHQQLRWLLEGLSIHQKKAHKTLYYEGV
jgi:transposase